MGKGTYMRHYEDEGYSDEELLKILSGSSLRDIRFAMKAIGRRKIKAAIPELENMAINDEDLSIQREAVLTIRKIGGKKALEILRGMRSGHREFAREMLNIRNTKELEDY